MIWELEYSDKEFSIQSREARGLPPPDWVEKEPPIYPGDDFLITAFYQLSSCRQFADVPGPIPWTAIIQYADRRGLYPDVALAFEHVIREMDAGYIKWYEKKQKALSPKVKTHGRFQRSSKNRS